MKKVKITLLITYLLINCGLKSYSQFQYEWSIKHPVYNEGQLAGYLEMDYHTVNAISTLSNGDFVCAGTLRLTGYYDNFKGLIRKYDNSKNILKSYYAEKNYDIEDNKEVLHLKVADASDDIYAIVHAATESFDIDTCFLIKLNSDLDILWTIKIPEATDMLLEVDGNGNALVAYVTNDSLAVSQKKVVVAKYALNNGNLIWSKNISDCNNVLTNTLNDLKIDKYGNAFLCGSVINPITQKNMEVVKLNANGTMAWRNYYDGGDANNLAVDDEAFCLAIDNEDNIVIAGQGFRSVNYEDIIMRKYDQQGNLLWHRRHDMLGTGDGARYIGVDNNNNYYVAGYADINAALLKFSKDGTLQWKKIFWDMNIYALHTFPEGGCLVSGCLYFSIGQSITSACKAHIKQVSDNGIVTWHYSDPKNLSVPDGYLLERYYYSRFSNIAVNNVSGQLLTGGSAWLGFYDYYGEFLQKINWYVVEHSISSAKNDLSIMQSEGEVFLYPNPVTNTLQIQFKEEITEAQLTVLDLQAREVMNRTIFSNDETINVSELKAGVYFVRIIYEGNVITKKFVKD